MSQQHSKVRNITLSEPICGLSPAPTSSWSSVRTQDVLNEWDNANIPFKALWFGVRSAGVFVIACSPTEIMRGEMNLQQTLKKRGGGKPSIISTSLK